MAIQIPQRVFLDTCTLVDLAQGKYPDAMTELTRMANQGEVIIVVTYDHVEEFGDSPCRTETLKEARVVDSLHPLWNPPGSGIYHREAYSEYLRLTGRAPLPPACPEASFSKSLLQWVRDCDLGPEWVAPFCTGQRWTFREAVEHLYDLENVQPCQGVGLELKNAFGDGRMWAKDRGLTEQEWDNLVRNTWIKHLCAPPRQGPAGECPEHLRPTLLGEYARLVCANRV